MPLRTVTGQRGDRGLLGCWRVCWVASELVREQRGVCRDLFEERRFEAPDRRWRGATVLVVALVPAVASAETVVWTEITRLVSPAPEDAGSFGSHVAVAGDTVAVSEAPLIYVFEGNANPIRLAPSDDVGGSGRVAMTDKTIVLGTTDGAYVFERGRRGWRQTARLAPSDGSDATVYSVAIDGNTVAAGVDGAVYVFVKAGRSWEQRATLTSGEEDDFFGRDVPFRETLCRVSTVPVRRTCSAPTAGAGGTKRRNSSLPARPLLGHCYRRRCRCHWCARRSL